MLKKINLLYALTSIAFLLLSFFDKGIIEIAIHDTYFIFSNSHLHLGISLVFGLYFLISTLLQRLQKPPNNIIVVIHWFLTTAGIYLIPLILQKIKETPQKFYDYSIYNSNETVTNNSNLDLILLTVFLITLAVQLIFLGNVIVSLILKKEYKDG